MGGMFRCQHAYTIYIIHIYCICARVPNPTREHDLFPFTTHIHAITLCRLRAPSVFHIQHGFYALFVNVIRFASDCCDDACLNLCFFLFIFIHFADMVRCVRSACPTFATRRRLWSECPADVWSICAGCFRTCRTNRKTVST